MIYDVIIIGSGISGIFTLKHCLEKKLKCIILEKSDNICGVWNIKNDPSVFSNTYSVSSKLYLSISDFPIPENYPEFPHWSLVLKYYKSYVQHFNLDDYILLKNEVTNIEKNNNKWNIQTTNFLFKSKNIVIASGSTNKCLNYPNMDLFKKFNGKTYHANDFGKLNLDTVLINKNIAVIGGSDTASDISVELSKNNKVFMSISNGQWFQDRNAGAFEPADMFYNRFINFFTKKIFSKNYVHNEFGTEPISVYWGAGGSGIKEWLPKCKYLNSYYNKSRDVIGYISKGKVIPKGKIIDVKNNSIKFINNENYENIDIIIFATGYKALDCFYFIKNQKIKDLPKYKHIFYPNDTSISFIGFIRPYLTSIPMLTEMQSRYIAEVYSNNVKLPNKEQIKKELINDIIKQKDEFKCSSKRIPFLVDPYDYCDDIGEKINCKPNIHKYFFTDNLLWKSIVLGSWNHYVYRLKDNDENKRKIAEEQLKKHYYHNTSVKIRTKSQRIIYMTVFKIIIAIIIIIGIIILIKNKYSEKLIYIFIILIIIILFDYFFRNKLLQNIVTIQFPEHKFK